MIEFETMARPYAKAIYNVSKLYNKTNAWLKQIEMITKVSEDIKVSRVLSFPELSTREKSNLLIDLLEPEDLDDFLKNFICVLADNGKIRLLPSIFHQFKDLFHLDENIVDATIYSAFNLENNEIENLIESIESSLDKKVFSNFLVDNKLIGGLKIEFGDKILDLSIKSQLLALKKNMLN